MVPYKLQIQRDNLCTQFHHKSREKSLLRMIKLDRRTTARLILKTEIFSGLQNQAGIQPLKHDPVNQRDPGEIEKRRSGDQRGSENRGDNGQLDNAPLYDP